MDVESLIKQVLEYNPHANVELIRKAYSMAKKAHTGKKRESGEDFFTHPLEITKILVDMRLDSPTLAAGLLHDVIEDTKVTAHYIREQFGEEVFSLVEGVTKIDEINIDSPDKQRAENIRKIMLATIKDVRVILIKLADRLHNMRTLKFKRPEKQKQIARETLEIYAPIAHKLGMRAIKTELEDLCLRFLEPETYTYFKEKIAAKKESRERDIGRIIELIQSKLKERNIKANVQGRAKGFYSIYQKMKKKSREFNEIYDLAALRIITDTVEDCYAALGVVHNLWRPMPHRFKDYISVPKSNGYQSLHTVVMGDHGKILEFQIRTWEMHYAAEEGIAAHWRYKNTERDKQFDKKISWLKQILEWLRESRDAKEFIDTLKIDLFKDEIIVFTPKGEPIPLPENATPIDFAYEVHTEVGNHCVRAKVNNRVVPLDHRLKSGDIVEIVTSKEAKPSRNWLKYAVTNLARSKIRQSLNLKLEHSQKEEEIKAVPTEKIEETVIGKIKPTQLKFSRCCNPQFGDPILAFKTKDGKITIHKTECINVHSIDPSRQVDLKWEEEKESHNVDVELYASDRVGMVSDVLKLLARDHVKVSSINTKAKKDGVLLSFTITIDDEKHKEKIFARLGQIGGVKNISEMPKGN